LPSFLAAKPTGPFKLSAFAPSSLVPFLLSRFLLLPVKEKKIFASRYKLLLPSEAELKAELLRELKTIRRRLPISAFSFQNFSFSAWHMNPALHDNPWIDYGTSLLWDAAARIRRMPLVWCAQIGFQSPVSPILVRSTTT
jgi:hypothetical protein